MNRYIRSWISCFCNSMRLLPVQSLRTLTTIYRNNLRLKTKSR